LTLNSVLSIRCFPDLVVFPRIHRECAWVWQAEPPATAYLAKARPNRQAQVQHGR